MDPIVVKKGKAAYIFRKQNGSQRLRATHRGGPGRPLRGRCCTSASRFRATAPILSHRHPCRVHGQDIFGLFSKNVVSYAV